MPGLITPVLYGCMSYGSAINPSNPGINPPEVNAGVNAYAAFFNTF
jgi:hypothetical protein